MAAAAEGITLLRPFTGFEPFAAQVQQELPQLPALQAIGGALLRIAVFTTGPVRLDAMGLQQRAGWIAQPLLQLLQIGWLLLIQGPALIHRPGHPSGVDGCQSW